ncbi:hypothetical protein SLS62_001807 [Diatrype stigma]|uniref:Uncharacterized protein n=1 Tax=Diatrype stigma TaxID=117547 RepID=A0AAN9YVS0_9PEZI
MDATATLQAPKTGGRSRFSKALPAPPPGLDEDPAIASRGLPPLPFPPRKESVSTTASTSRSVKMERFDSPLPALPPKVDDSQKQSPKNMIPRRPVGQPAPKSTKKKRVSSISSLLSAYSNGSSDSVHRSSQETVLTKDSDPSHSRAHGEAEDPKDLTRILMAYSSNPYGDDSPTDRNGEMDFPMPPSTPSSKVKTEPSTPRSMRPLKVSPDAVTTTSPSITSTNESPKQEIWRRRAGSKSEVGIAVPELKLAVSYGSTAATALDMPGEAPAQHELRYNNTEAKPLGLPSGSDARLRSAPSYDILTAPAQPPQKPLPPQPQSLERRDGATAFNPQSKPIEYNPSVSDESTAPYPNSIPAPRNNSENKNEILPPRLGSLPGKNIRPRQQTAPIETATGATDKDKRSGLTPAAEPSNETSKDFLKVSPRPEVQQKTLKGLPPSPRMDAQPAKSPAEDDPKDQPAEHKSLPRTLLSIARKGLPTPTQSPSNASTSVSQPARSPATTGSSLPSPDDPARGSERYASPPPAAGTAAGSQPKAQHLKTDSTSSRGPTGLRRPGAVAPLGALGGDPSNRAAGVRPARSQPDLGFSARSTSSNYTHGKQGSTGGRRVSPTSGTPQSRDFGGNIQGTVQVEPPPVGQPLLSSSSPNATTTSTPSPAAAAAADASFPQGSGLFDLVTSLNYSSSDNISSKDSSASTSLASSLGKGLRSRPALFTHDSRPLSQINEVPRQSTDKMDETPRGVGGDEEQPAEQSKEVHEALSRFPRERLELLHLQSNGHGGSPAQHHANHHQPSSSTATFATTSTAANDNDDRVWPSRPPSKENFNCWTGHETMVPTRNTHYALACQACGGEERSWRKVCSWCSLRICYDCAALLAQSGGDLRRTMDAAKARRRQEKGKEKMELGLGPDLDLDLDLDRGRQGQGYAEDAYMT